MRPPEPDAATARLVVGTGESECIVPLTPLPFTLGRAAERHLCLPDPWVSREHAMIDRDADGYFLRDLGSRHGTLINGIRIAAGQSRLRDGDRIQLGSSRDPILFEAEQDQSTTRTILAKLTDSGGARGDLQTLALFLQAAQSLNSRGALNDVLRTMLEYTIRLTHAERGFVFLGATARSFQLAFGIDSKGAELADASTASASIIADAAGSEQDFMLADASEEADKAGRESLLLNSIRSVAAIPLRGLNSGRLLGMLYLDSQHGAQDFTRIGKEILHVISRQAAMLLENLTMLEAEREAVLLRKELEIAAQIQRQIIPRQLPQCAGVRLAAASVPCLAIGGDFYDVIPVPGGFVAVVADICGKGIPAALLASMAQGMLHSQITSGASLVDAVTRVSQFVCARAPLEKYLTMLVLRYARAEGEPARVELVNGGHIPPLIVRADGSRESVPGGDMPVGLVSFATFHALHCELGTGDRLVLLSDGVTEAENHSEEQFGVARVAAAVVSPEPVAGLFEALGTFCGTMPMQDDQTVLTIEVV